MHLIATTFYPLAFTGTSHERTQTLKDVDTSDDAFTLSEADRTSYEKVFSSILVPFASLTVGEDIGQGTKFKTFSVIILVGQTSTFVQVH